jgi:hypothetical protein
MRRCYGFVFLFCGVAGFAFGMFIFISLHDFFCFQRRYHKGFVFYWSLEIWELMAWHWDCNWVLLLTPLLEIVKEYI